MVKVKDETHLTESGAIDVEAWLAHVQAEHQYTDIACIRAACVLCELAGKAVATEYGSSCLQAGLATAELLVDMHLDAHAVAAAIITPLMRMGELSQDDISEQLGPLVAKLSAGVMRMEALSNMRAVNPGMVNHQTLDNIRKMLLAMVDDVRIVVIKLAERVILMRTIAHLSDDIKKPLAIDTREIYAPLANRLGIGHMKWELEDLSFRFLNPEQYKTIAKALKSRRVDRDRYVGMIVAQLESILFDAGIKHAQIYGRAKHINSIHQKMLRKAVPIEEIYDATAVRILVDTVEDCYNALSCVHNAWTPIPVEFDDYITNQKPNGYQSLHTAVVGPEDKVFEVQIRTHKMHELAEMGVAAHWKYKEAASGSAAAHEQKIEWLREVLAWQQDVADNKDVPQNIGQAFIEERVYIFTPEGDIIELPPGATPLDFAYHIHSAVGHRCRGAKIDGHIVPLTHPLKTGERVEILTTKLPQPSRDWLNPHAGYLKTSRAKSKVLHWFKQQDYDENLISGRELLDKECQKLHINKPDLTLSAKQLNYKKADDLLASLGRGDIRLGQIMQKIAPREQQSMQIPTDSPAQRVRISKGGDVTVEGVSDLLTSLGRCCQPVLGDAIIGYVTVGKGITIHRSDCSNILHINPEYHTRLVAVTWAESPDKLYPVEIALRVHDRPGLLRDVTNLLALERVNVINMGTRKSQEQLELKFSIEVSSLDNLSAVLDKLKTIPSVLVARRIES